MRVAARRSPDLISRCPVAQDAVVAHDGTLAGLLELDEVDDADVMRVHVQLSRRPPRRNAHPRRKTKAQFGGLFGGPFLPPKYDSLLVS